jgi:hypothetical protein
MAQQAWRLSRVDKSLAAKSSPIGQGWDATN